MDPNRRASVSSSEDGYISMEVDDAAAALFLHHHYNHRRHRSSSAKEFEFQSFSSSSDADRSAASPADELFYMGKLLPLHLPPRLQLVHSILAGQNDDDAVEFFSTPAATTPFQSCNISPSESCHVSAELNPAEYFLDYFSEAKLIKSKVKTVKNRSSFGFGSKLNWRYFKSLFTKSAGCSSAAASAGGIGVGKLRSTPKSAKQFQNGNLKTDTTTSFRNLKNSKTETAPFGQIRYKKENNDSPEDDRRGGKGSHRRSFSGAFKRLSKPKNFSISSSSTVTVSASEANLMNYRQILKRCSSSSCSSEMENPIQAAIAHCKRSQRPAMTASRDELGFLSGYGGGKERMGVCRG